ncbi:MAG: GH3 auxin-responsive promoter family protein [Alphaproteobacteria bacterium]|nr:GH3 auxin-responsive promoter family protein [Alphaproteobacteria bacterium]
MPIKKIALALFAKRIQKNIANESKKALQHQIKILNKLVLKAQNTIYGKEHHFETIKNYGDFIKQVPIVNYEQIKPYIDTIFEGKKDVLWPGQPTYFAKTSGTTSGIKYIPISSHSIHNHINTARNCLFNYVAQKKCFDIFNGKMIFLSGSPELETKHTILIGRLSGIVNHHVPSYLKSNKLPSWETNCLENWEQKLDAIIEETYNQDLRVISGIPPWVIMYFEGLIKKTGKTITELFPNLQLIIHGGVNYQPYIPKIKTCLGSKHVDQIELFPASEGFFAFQTSLDNEGLFLNTNSGIFYEFIPFEYIGNPFPKRIMLADVELDKTYLLIVTNNAGLWAYDIGDLIKFVSLTPFKIKVVGRSQHFISAFGEHVIAEEVESVMLKATHAFQLEVFEFTVAPHVQIDNENYHEWWIEMATIPQNLPEIAHFIDQNLQEKNIYYADLRRGNILKEIKIVIVKPHTFQNYMKSIGKLGGQNKLPRLANNRNIVDGLKNLDTYE